MIEYDILTSGPNPPFPTPFGTLIRAAYTPQGIVSSLIGANGPSGMELMLTARPGYSIETVSNPIHHHISILTSNAKAYAKTLGTMKFFFEYQRVAKEDFLVKRFPSWELIGHSSRGFPILELKV